VYRFPDLHPHPSEDGIHCLLAKLIADAGHR